MADDWQMRGLRASRAQPPNLAANDPTRRALYNAGLEQFEQLLVAAEAVGPAARPLPLFYALSQAGRSIVAALGEDAEIAGHGLREDKVNPPPEDLLHRRIERSPRQDGRDAFSAVSQATGSFLFDGGVELGALWASLPGSYRIPDGSWLPEWRPVLAVLDETSSRGAEGEIRVQAMSAGGNPHLDAVSTLRGRYPSLPADTKVGVKESVELGRGNWFAVLTWDEKMRLEQVATGTILDESALQLRPTLPGQQAPVSDLMSWWTLLFGLSIFARYHPGLWMEALAVDRSELAVPLEAMLDRALSVVPALVHEALFG
jgi:hypothetical protein